MKKKEYSSEERTKAQFEFAEYKRAGYYIDRITEVDEFTGEEIIIAFGCKPSHSHVIKESRRVLANEVKETDYKFIYWN